MLADDAAEDIGTVGTEVAIELHLFDHADHGVMVLDLSALMRLARPVAVLEINGERVVMIEPIGKYSHHADFDRRVVDAGLTRYFRTELPGDAPLRGDPDGVPPGFEPVPGMLVEAVEKDGRRMLQGSRLLRRRKDPARSDTHA
jgi:hypothetical protein